MKRRVHAGCGIRSPFIKWMWVTLALGVFISWSVVGLTWGSLLGLLGMLGWVPWLAVVAANIRWERVHSPAKMYRTWSP